LSARAYLRRWRRAANPTSASSPAPISLLETQANKSEIADLIPKFISREFIEQSNQPIDNFIGRPSHR